MNDETYSYAGTEDHFVTAEPVEAVEAVDEPGTPWGFWLTLLFSGAVLGLFVTVQTVVVVPFAVVQIQRHPQLSPEELTKNLESNGLCLGLATLFSAPVCVGLVWLLAKLRGGISVRRYLGLNRVGKREILFWGLAVSLFMLTSDGLTYLIGRDVVPPQMTGAYETAGFVPLLWFAIICLAPLFEEVFFRGFMFAGISQSRLGDLGAILITALVWAGIHMQYDFYQISLIFVGGLLLGTARLRTGSVYVTIGMHAVWNIIAMVETAVVVASG